MDTLPCKFCIKFAICKAKQDPKISSWSKLRPIWRSCEDLFTYLNHKASSKYLLNNERLYETYDLFRGKTTIGF
jgi:hypothetical protein